MGRGFDSLIIHCELLSGRRSGGHSPIRPPAERTRQGNRGQRFDVGQDVASPAPQLPPTAGITHMLAPTPCLETNCHNHVTTQGRCQEHQRPWAGSTRKQRLPPDWATRRLIVLKRDNGVCHLCGGDGADTVDHVTQGDNHSLTNLAPVHDRTPPHCHRFKSSTEGHQAQQGNKTKRRH